MKIINTYIDNHIEEQSICCKDFYIIVKRIKELP